MTTFRQVTNQARSDFGSLVATPLGITYSWDNAEFSKPSPFATEPRYCSVAVRYDPTEQSTTGNTATFTKSGRVLVNAYSPISRMDQPVLEIADAVKAAFRELTSGGVLYFHPELEGPPERDGENWRLPISIPFLSRVTAARNDPADGTVGYEDAGNTIRSRFQTKIVDVQGIPVIWDNSDDDLPATGLGVRFAIRFGGTRMRALGARDYQTSGLAFAMIFDRMNTGDKASLDLVDAIDAEFRAVTDSGVTFMAPTPRVIGRSGGRWQTNMVIPFVYHEVAVT